MWDFQGRLTGTRRYLIPSQVCGPWGTHCTNRAGVWKVKRNKSGHGGRTEGYINKGQGGARPHTYVQLCTALAFLPKMICAFLCEQGKKQISFCVDVSDTWQLWQTLAKYIKWETGRWRGGKSVWFGFLKANVIDPKYWALSQKFENAKPNHLSFKWNTSSNNDWQSSGS